MQLITLFGLTAYLALASAAPLKARDVTITFNGAAGAAYSLSVPLDGTVTYTNNALSISTIYSPSVDVETQCTLVTVDYPPALVEGPTDTWAVGPPQTVISIACTGGSPPQPPSSIEIQFNGADPSQGAFYTLTVPLDGSTIPTNNVLSISTLVSSYAALESNCVFSYVDYTAALVLIAPQTWAVGPPQTIETVSCH